MEIINAILSFYEKGDYNSKEKYDNAFKLPIEYLDTSSLFVINNNIVNDLELVKANELAITNNSLDHSANDAAAAAANNDDANYNLYYHVFDPKTIFEKNVINKWSKYYTNNKEFLLETQDLIKNYKPLKKVEFSDSPCVNDLAVYNNCENIIYDNGFVNKYQYIDIPLLNKFNNNSLVLQALSVYNLTI